MSNTITERVPAPDYTVVFAKMNEAGNVEVVRQVATISAQSDTMRLIAQATPSPDNRHVVTFLS